MRNFINIPILQEAGADGRLIIPELQEDKAEEYSGFFRMLALVPVQTHSTKVAIVGRNYSYMRPEADAVVTFDLWLPVGVVTADCVPILIYSPDIRGVAAIHAGWKGTLGGIVDNTLDVLEQHGASCAEMKVVFGPSIGVDRYEVDSDLAGKFVEAGFADCVAYPEGEEGKPHLDLQRVSVERLCRRGVLSSNIVRSSESTFDAKDDKGENLYPSYRRDNATNLRFMTSVMLVDENGR